MKKSDELNTVDGIVQIVEWRKVDMGDRGAYMVTTKDKKIGLLFVDSDPDQPGRSVVAHVVGFDAKDSKSYRDGAIQMPVDLEKAIAQMRLRRIVRGIMSDLLSVPDPENPALKMVAWCLTLERGYVFSEMSYLFEEFAEVANDDVPDLDAEDYVHRLREVNADCERLWPEQVDRAAAP
jgi:hypothetical protein